MKTNKRSSVVRLRKTPALDQALPIRLSGAHHKLLFGALAASASLFIMQPAQASNVVWTGNTSTDWSLAGTGNWSAPLAATDVATFSTTFTNQPSLTAATASGGLWLGTGLGQDVTIGGSQTLTLSGASTVNGNAAAAILMDDTANHNLTIGAGVSTTIGGAAYTPNVYVNNAGTLTFLGSLTAFAGRTLTFGGTNASGQVVVAGGMTSTTGAVTINTAGKVNYTSAALYTGATTITSGTLQLSGATGSVANSAILIAGGSLLLDNTSADNSSRISAAGPLTIYGGNFTYKGSDSVNSAESTGQLKLYGGSPASITVSPGAAHSATFTVASIATGGYAAGVLINGANLGMDSTTTANVGRFISTAAPTLVGTTNATATGINTGAKNTKIASYLVGEATQATGGKGTATGMANTFLTYNATTGFRPLNPTDEFTNNDIVATNNTYITQATTAAATAAINSLVINGGDLSIADGKTVTNTSGALIFASNNSIRPEGSTGTLAFGSNGGSGGMVTVNSGIIAGISALSGVNGFIKVGAGTLVASGNNSTYSGATYVNSGTLAIANDGALGAGAIWLNGQGGLLAASGGPVTLSNAININQGNNTFGGVIGGSNDLTLNGLVTNVYNAVEILTVNNTGLTTLAGGLNLSSTTDNGSRSFTINGNGTVKISGAVTNGGLNGTNACNLSYVGNGKLILSGTNTYTGSTAIGANAGTSVASTIVNYQNAASFGTSAITVTNATLQVEGGITFEPSSLTVRGALESVSGNNTYTGLLKFSNSVAASILSDADTFTLSNTGAIAATNVALTLGGDGDGILASSFGASTAAGITKNGTGTWMLSGANTYTGKTLVNAGTLQFGKAAALYNGAPASWTAANIDVKSGGTLAVNVGGVTGFTSANLDTLKNLGTANSGFESGSFLGIDTTNGDFTYNSNIANPNSGANVLGIVKGGSNKLTLNGGNTYTGTTLVKAGTLALGLNGSVSNSSAINVLSGAAFDVSAKNANPFTVLTGQTLTNNGTVAGNLNVAGKLGGTGTVTGNLAITDGGELAPGNSPGIQTVVGDFSLSSGATLSMQLNAGIAGVDYDQLIVGGNIMLGGTLALTFINGTPVDDVFTLILNNGAQPVSGFFSSITVGGNALTLDSGMRYTDGDRAYTFSYVDATGGVVADDLQLTVAAVPEPGTWAMLVGGFGMLVFSRRFRCRSI